MIEVKAGQTAADVASTLKAEDVVKSTQAFIEVAYADPDASSLQPGFYALQHKMAAADALATVLDPSARIQARVTLPEGLRLDETLQRLAKDTELPLKDYEKALKNRAGELGLPGVRQGQPGGLPVPGHLRRPAGRRRRRRPRASCSTAYAANAEKAGVERTQRTPEEIVIIASLVEAEARHAGGLRQGRPGRLQPARAGHAAAVRLDGQLRAQGRQGDRHLRGPRRRLAVQHLQEHRAAAGTDQLARAGRADRGGQPDRRATGCTSSRPTRRRARRSSPATTRSSCGSRTS